MPSRSHSETRRAAVHRRPAVHSEERPLADERKLLIEAALNGLAAPDREILMRFYLDEQSQDEICAEMGLTETQFRLIKSRAKTRLAELSRKVLNKRPLAKSAATPVALSEHSVVDIARVVPVVAHAVAVFGDEQKASHWLATPLALLDNRSPAHILARSGDVEAVDRILTRIEHNIPS